jgi:hypothetical protein
MLCCSSNIGKAIPKEYRKVAEVLFSAGIRQNCLDFADKLGVATDYRRFDSGWQNHGELEKLLHSFRNNLELLIQKTWVEKADEDRKEKLLDRIPDFITLINERDYFKALGEFGAILEELAWLLFGSQSRENDFFDYVFRIDHQLGLFWWYGGQLEHFLASGQKDEETLRAVLLLGLCYITDF